MPAQWIALANLLSYPTSMLLLAMLLEWLLPLPASARPSALVPLLEQLSRKVNPPNRPVGQQWLSGLLTPLVILLPTWMALWALHTLALSVALFDLVLLIWLLEWRPIDGDIRALLQLLATDKLAMARLQLARWTRRDTAQLSRMGLCKAAAEMLLLRWLGQWFGVAFWYLLGGLPAALTFRLLQLMAQAFSGKLPRNAQFAMVTTQAYRLLLWLPGYVAAMFLALFQRGGLVLKAIRRQSHHWASAGSGALLAAAGASLGIRLGGPRFYLQHKVRYPNMGGVRDPEITDLDALLQRMRQLISLLLVILFALLAVRAYVLLHH